MGKPRIKPGIYNAKFELTSARSSLHMPAEEIPKEELNGNELFLDELDVWVKHSSEHIQSAFRSLQGLDNRKTRRVFKQYIKLACKIDRSEILTERDKKIKIQLIITRLINHFIDGPKFQKEK